MAATSMSQNDDEQVIEIQRCTAYKPIEQKPLPIALDQNAVLNVI